MGDNKEVIFLGTYQPGRKFGWLDFSTSLENAYSELSDMFTFPYYSDKNFFRSNIKRQKYHLFRIGNSTITHYMGTSNKIGKEVLLEKISGTKYAFIAHTHDMKVCNMDSSEKRLFSYMKNHIAKEECMFYRVCLNPEITNPNSVPDMIDFALGETNNHLLDFPKDDPEAFYDECMKYAIAERYEVDVNGYRHSSCWWWFDNLQKGHSDFTNPEIYAKMFTYDQPHLWCHEKTVEDNGELWTLSDEPENYGNVMED